MDALGIGSTIMRQLSLNNLETAGFSVIQGNCFVNHEVMINQIPKGVKDWGRSDNKNYLFDLVLCGARPEFCVGKSGKGREIQTHQFRLA